MTAQLLCACACSNVDGRSDLARRQARYEQSEDTTTLSGPTVRGEEALGLSEITCDPFVRSYISGTNTYQSPTSFLELRTISET